MSIKKISAIFLCITIITIDSYSQKLNNSLSLSVGKSWHGTGDLNGIIIEVAYDKGLNKHFSFSNALTTTIHYKKDVGFNDLFPGISPDNNLMRFTTAGIQTTSLLHYALLVLPKHKFRLNGGLVLRFQSTNYPEQFRYVQDPNIYPDPFYVIYEPGNQHNFRIGYSAGLSYLFTASDKLELGLRASFQNDTNGDTITHIGFTIGRILKNCK